MPFLRKDRVSQTRDFRQRGACTPSVGSLRACPTTGLRYVRPYRPHVAVVHQIVAAPPTPEDRAKASGRLLGRETKFHQCRTSGSPTVISRGEVR